MKRRGSGALLVALVCGLFAAVLSFFALSSGNQKYAVLFAKKDVPEGLVINPATFDEYFGVQQVMSPDLWGGTTPPGLDSALDPKQPFDAKKWSESPGPIFAPNAGALKAYLSPRDNQPMSGAAVMYKVPAGTMMVHKAINSAVSGNALASQLGPEYRAIPFATDTIALMKGVLQNGDRLDIGVVAQMGDTSNQKSLAYTFLYSAEIIGTLPTKMDDQTELKGFLLKLKPDQAQMLSLFKDKGKLFFSVNQRGSTLKPQYVEPYDGGVIRPADSVAPAPAPVPATQPAPPAQAKKP